MILVMDDVLQLILYETRSLLGWIIISSITLIHKCLFTAIMVYTC